MLNVGDEAPDFELASHLGNKVKLSDFRGDKNVVIAFYPLDWTGVCGKQMPAYESDSEKFERLGAKVLGISGDSIPSHVAWANSMGCINYDLLADFHPKGEVAKKYGVWREADGFSERALFVVDKEGKIVYKNVHEILDQPNNEVVFEVLEKM